jgi:hypothetical protein
MVDTYWGDGYAVARAEQRFIAGDPPPTSDFRQVRSPLTDEMLRPSLTGRGVVQFDRRLTDDDFRLLGEWFRAYPAIDLRAYGSYDHSITDLEFLRFFPTLRRFAADALWDSLTSLDGLRHLPPDLEELGIARRRPSSTSASCLAFRGCDGSSSDQTSTLRCLGPDQLYDLARDRCDARPVAASPLKGFGPWIQARRHARPPIARVGSWYRSLDDPRLTDVTPSADLVARSLFLQALRGRGASDPELGDLAAASLETMKGLRPDRSLRRRRRGRRPIDMRHLQPETLAGRAGSQAIRRGWERRKNDARAAAASSCAHADVARAKSSSSHDDRLAHDTSRGDPRTVCGITPLSALTSLNASAKSSTVR